MPRDSPERIPGLDGLRAIAIACVIVGHSASESPHDRSHRLVALGLLGVTVFFVISGYLITTLLLRERAKTGGISLAGFYVRRVYRIFPAFYVYVAVIAALSLAGVTDLLFGATYLMDFHAQKSWNVGHLWSLAVEEQFYLLWPALLALSRRALPYVLAAIVLGPLLRLGAWIEWPAVRGMTDRAFPFVFDALAIGCALAMLRERLEKLRWYTAIVDSQAFWLIPGAAFLAQNHHVYIDLGVQPTLTAVAAAMTIHRVCLRNTESIATRVLESAPLVWVGTLSYSLYLWQQPFLNRQSGSFYCHFPQNIVMAVAAATLSYYLIERPVLRFRQKRKSRR